MIRLLLAFIIILPSICGCETDKKSPLEKSDSYSLKKTSQIQKEPLKLPGEALFDHPGYSRESRRKPPIPKVNSVTVNNYLCEVKESADGKERCLIFSRNGKKIRSECSEIGSFSILMYPPAGTDINGDGIPDIIVEYYSGGAHCCYQNVVVSLGKRLKPVAILNGEHTDFEFKDLDGDGQYEAIGRDWTFAYWNASFAGSPAPTVILRFSDGKYHLVTDLMKKPPPNKDDLLMKAIALRKDVIERHTEVTTQSPPPGFFKFTDPTSPWDWDSRLWAAMLELIYSGNADLAWEFNNKYWSYEASDFPSDKKRFMREFKRTLATSPYWIDLKKMSRSN